MFNKELTEAFEQLGKGKKIDPLVLIDSLEKSLSSASKKILGSHYDIKVAFDEEKGGMRAYYVKNVVENVVDIEKEITKDAAEKLGVKVDLGDNIQLPVSLKEFGRIAAQITKQVISRKVRDIERDAMYEEFKKKEGEILNGVVLRKENKNLIIDLGDIEGIIPLKEQVFRENYQIGEKIKVYVLEVKRSIKTSPVFLSRIHPGFIMKLFESEIPEIAEGKVKIKNVARDPGYRIKIAVCSEDGNIDAVGACVGIKGGRIQPIVRELKGEKIDVIEWNDDIKILVKNALRPAKITDVSVDEVNKIARVVVPEDHLSLAIGKNGQSAKLTSKLTGWKIDVVSEKKAVEEVIEKKEAGTEKDEGLEADFTGIPGIGKSIAKKLKENGFKSIKDLAGADVNVLCEIKGISEKAAKKIIGESSKILSGDVINTVEKEEIKDDKEKGS